MSIGLLETFDCSFVFFDCSNVFQARIVPQLDLTIVSTRDHVVTSEEQSFDPSFVRFLDCANRLEVCQIPNDNATIVSAAEQQLQAIKR